MPGPVSERGASTGTDMKRLKQTKWGIMAGLRNQQSCNAVVFLFSVIVLLTTGPCATATHLAAVASKNAEFSERQRGLAAFHQHNYTKAMSLWKKAAEAGNAKAMYDIGTLYMHGWGVSQNYKDTMAWYRKAVAAGDTHAIYGIGFLYDKGLGVPQSYQKAVALWRKAAAAGSIEAMYAIGLLYEEGLGFPQNYQKAMKWYRKAAASGYTAAMVNIGSFYAHGQGVPQNYQKAMAWWRKAAAKGNAEAAAALWYPAPWVLISALAVLLAISVLICYLLQICYSRIPRDFRRLHPGLVWLLLVPIVGLGWNSFGGFGNRWNIVLALGLILFGLVWCFFVFLGLTYSYQAYFASLEKTDAGDCGRAWGLAFCICASFSPFAFFSPIPDLGGFSGIAALILLVILMFKMVRLRNQINVTPTEKSAGR